MAQTYLFYDLETSGFSPKEARIMQFAGQRTDMELNIIGKPFNYLIRMTNDILPDPQAILTTGITPQQTLKEGISEAEFLKIFYERIAIAGTIFVGFNSVRFDDEFMRYMNYRNFYDPYEWAWKDQRSRWDLLDVVRLMRALRPGGMNWPKDEEGKATNTLELLAIANSLAHKKVHDAMSDVSALIGLAKLVKLNQPKLFNYLRTIMTDKKKIEQLVTSSLPFIYTSGKYPAEYEKTTAVGTLTLHPKRQAALVFDLRQDPLSLSELSVEDIVKIWAPEGERNRDFPIKTLMFNRCPAIAPLSVLDHESEVRLSLKIDEIKKNYENLVSTKAKLTPKVLEATAILDEVQNKKYAAKQEGVDTQLYDGFFVDKDKARMYKVTSAEPSDLKDTQPDFDDDRLNGLLPLYKARNFPNILSIEETKVWESFRERQLLGGKEISRMSRYFDQLSFLSSQEKQPKSWSFILDELKLYGESIIPHQG